MTSRKVADDCFRRQYKKSKSSISLVLSPNLVLARQLHSFLTHDLQCTTPLHSISLHLAPRQTDFEAFINPTIGIEKHIIIVSHPKAVSRLLDRETTTTFVSALSLVISDELDALHPDYELLLSYLLTATGSQTRFIGFSAPLLDVRDLAAWLKVEPLHTYAFHPSSRPSSIITSTTTFNLSHSPGLLKAMVKPAYDTMRLISGTSLCIVPHRAQCFITMGDFLTHSATDLNKFVSMDEESLRHYTAKVLDPKIAEGLLHGFAILSESMHPTDQVISQHLFQTGAVRVLIVPREACYKLTLTANLVIVMGTQYAAAQPDTKDWRIINYPLNDLLRMQTRAIGQSQNESGQFAIFTQPDMASSISRFLTEGLPLESPLFESDVLLHAILSSALSDNMPDRQACLDAIAVTFLGQRLGSNPTYYGCEAITRQGNISRFVDSILENCRRKCLVRLKGDFYFSVTAFGAEVSRRQLDQAQLNSMFTSGEDSAIRLARAFPNDENESLANDLEVFLQRLPKSLQRQARSSPSGTEISYFNQALLITFFARKLPSEGSKLEVVQARLAIAAMERLHSHTNGREKRK